MLIGIASIFLLVAAISVSSIIEYQSMFLALTALGLTGVIIFMVLSIMSKIKILSGAICIALSLFIGGYGVYLGTQPAINLNVYEYVDGVGWKAGIGTTKMTEQEYKTRCNDVLAYSQYESNPWLYIGVICKMEDVVVLDVLDIEDSRDIFIIVYGQGSSWVCRVMNSSVDSYKFGDFVSVYGEFVSVDKENELLYMRCRYVDIE
jgi:hypothetical protein